MWRRCACAILRPPRPNPTLGRVGRAPGSTPAEQEELGAVFVVEIGRRDVFGDAGDLGGANAAHRVVVLGVVADVAGAVFLLEAADAVHQLRRARNRPRPGERLGITQVGPVLVAVVELGRERHRDVGHRVEIGQVPRLGAVGEVAVGEQDHRRAVLDRETHRLERGVEAISRRLRGDDRQRRFTVAAVHREQQVGLLGLGRQSGRRTTTLHVDQHQRQLETDREADRLRLEVDTRTAGRGDRRGCRRTHRRWRRPRPRSRLRPAASSRRSSSTSTARAGCRTQE